MGCCGSKDATESEIGLTDAQSIRSVSSHTSSEYAGLGIVLPKPPRRPPSIASLTSSEFADLENGPPERFAPPDGFSGLRMSPYVSPTPSRTPSLLNVPWVPGPPGSPPVPYVNI
jgi:hypothetical protein